MPSSVIAVPASREPHHATPPELPGFSHLYSGKVRDLYSVDAAADVVLVVASDRISAYDHVLPTPIPDKGVVLTQLSVWWFEQLADLVDNHVVSIQDVPDQVAGRAMLCRRLDMAPVECVARGYLAGSGWADYRESGAVCGIDLPPGLHNGSRLPEPLFTPATKAELGEHDENITIEDVARLVGPERAMELRELTLAVYARAEEIARERGVILADTKLEFGLSPGGMDRGYVLADEVLTPDSSRFWPAEQWQPGESQPSFDKQFVRDWLTSPASGWDKDSGHPPPELPPDVVERTRQRYLEAYRRLTGCDLPAP
jgi:phosphoribosylaminoimidazole-succinocarboxamide synthase